MLQLLKLFKKHSTQQKAAVLNRMIDDSLNDTVKRIQSIEPETENQWKRLEKTMAQVDKNKTVSQLNTWRYFLKPSVAVGLAMTLLVVFGIFWVNHSSVRIYETAKGQHSNIVLQDSTEIKLNSFSELIVTRQLLEKSRRVTLKGEALFHVQRTGTPFIITTEVGTIQVLGTEFNVRVRDGNLEVAVLSGRVQLTGNKDGRDSSIILSTGQLSRCGSSSFPERPVALPFPDYPGWTQGKFIFYKSSLLDACKEIESQFDIEIKIEKPQLQHITLTGVITGQNADAALETLVQLTGNKFRHENDSYIIY